jgi:hypothetical protein
VESLPQGSGTLAVAQDAERPPGAYIFICYKSALPSSAFPANREGYVGRKNVMARGQPVIRGQIPSGNVPDETVAQEEQGVPPTIVMPFSGVTVSDGTDPVQATVDFYGTGTVEAASGMTAITGVPGTGSTWQTGYVSPAALTAILQGVAVQIGAIGHIGSSGVPNSRQVVALTVTDQITGQTATDGLEYDQVHGTIGGVVAVHIEQRRDVARPQAFSLPHLGVVAGQRRDRISRWCRQAGPLSPIRGCRCSTANRTPARWPRSRTIYRRIGSMQHHPVDQPGTQAGPEPA